MRRERELLKRDGQGRHRRKCVVVGAALALALGCSPTSEGDDAPRVEPTPQPNGSEPSPEPGVSGLVDEGESSFVPIDETGACAVERADTVQSKEPVDIIVIVDNSASMANELAATERNINENFAQILQDSGLDYRMIVLTLHRRVPRTGYGQSATMLCVTEPLSALRDCTEAAEPRFSDHFFQYSTRIESADSFDVLLDTFEPPFDDEDREDEFGNAPGGWSEWLRPGIKKVFLELTDDNENMPPADFVRALTELAPEHFGSDPDEPTFVFHSIVGVAEKTPATEPYYPTDALQEATCSKLGALVTSSGETYQELSRLTGGLRFPICVSSQYDVVFREIAGRVVLQSDIACDFPLPAPPEGRQLDLDRVSISIEHELTGTPATVLGQARLAGDCQSDAFYLDGQTVRLCPDACTAVRGEEGARVDVLFGCESSIIVR
ncbi:MAG TPA: hypothetical protein VMG12_18525 [Polyangiaceae bacterium]|nr:hypothetical protein [Polyangiaceae bacterium]